MLFIFEYSRYTPKLLISYFTALSVVVKVSYVACQKSIRQKSFKSSRGGQSSHKEGGGTILSLYLVKIYPRRVLHQDFKLIGQILTKLHDIICQMALLGVKGLIGNSTNLSEFDLSYNSF